MRMNGTPAGFAFRLLIGLLFVLIGLELFFRFGIHAKDYPRGNHDPCTNISNFDTSWVTEGVGSFGALCKPMGHWKINNAGWNSIFPYSGRGNYNRPRVAIVGNSYIEGWASDVEAHVDAQLYSLFNRDVDVYAFWRIRSLFCSMSRNPTLYRE